MKTFEIKIQFYSNNYPSAVGWFIVEAECLEDAAKKEIEELYNSGYAVNDISLISITERS